MSKVFSYPIRDNEAYEERLAIILESWTDDLMTPYRLANETANSTRYSKVATAMLHGDMEPLNRWMRELNSQVAEELRSELTELVLRETEWRHHLQQAHP